MVLKEAYRYQNYLTDLINEARDYLNKRGFITTTEQKHKRIKANPDATDEVVVLENGYEVEFTPMQLVDFIMDAIEEKQKLSDAIVEAKKKTEIDIDSSISLNKIKQAYINTLNAMASVKPSNKIERGIGYRFNPVDGNQVSYYYDIENVTTINYDRDNVRKLAKKLQKETDGVSTKLDTIQITTEINFAPKWDISDTLEDVVLS